MAYYPQYYHKTDKDGRPLYIEQLGKVDLNALRKITTDDRMLQNLVVEYEKVADPRLPACSRKADQLLETCCTIMDLKGVGISQASHVYGYVGKASAISQNYYPERLGKMYVINAPWGFSGVWSVIKRFLDPVTVNKVHILGSGYQKELLAQVPKENLPKEFGGNCQCQGGCQLSDEGPCKQHHGSLQESYANTLVQGRIRNTRSRPRGPKRKTTTLFRQPRATLGKASRLTRLMAPNNSLLERQHLLLRLNRIDGAQDMHLPSRSNLLRLAFNGLVQ